MALTRADEETRDAALLEGQHVDSLGVAASMLGKDAQDALDAADTPRPLTPITHVSDEKHMPILPAELNFACDEALACDEAFCGICGQMADDDCVGCDNESCMQWFHLVCLGDQKPDIDLPQATLDEMIWWCPNCAPL